MLCSRSLNNSLIHIHKRTLIYDDNMQDDMLLQDIDKMSNRKTKLSMSWKGNLQISAWFISTHIKGNLEVRENFCILRNST